MCDSDKTGLEPWQLAMQYVGTPWRHMGRSKRALDCAGLLVVTAHDWGMDPVYDSTYYGREPARNNNSFQLRWLLAQNLGAPVIRPYRVNDVVLMKLRPRFDPAHVGIIKPHKNGLGLIHCYGEIGRVAAHRIDDTWHSRIIEVYPWPS